MWVDLGDPKLEPADLVGADNPPRSADGQFPNHDPFLESPPIGESAGDLRTLKLLVKP